jgi:hypothetical protein
MSNPSEGPGSFAKTTKKGDRTTRNNDLLINFVPDSRRFFEGLFGVSFV